MDAIQFKILEDGTISITTDAVSPANHYSADELLKAIHQIGGGTRQTRKRMDVAASLANALHSHAHDGHTHTH
jgi:hypothetical protein